MFALSWRRHWWSWNLAKQSWGRVEVGSRIEIFRVSRSVACFRACEVVLPWMERSGQRFNYKFHFPLRFCNILLRFRHIWNKWEVEHVFFAQKFRHSIFRFVPLSQLRSTNDSWTKSNRQPPLPNSKTPPVTAIHPPNPWLMTSAAQTSFKTKKSLKSKAEICFSGPRDFPALWRSCFWWMPRCGYSDGWTLPPIFAFLGDTFKRRKFLNRM